MVSVNQLGLLQVLCIMNKFRLFTFYHLSLAGSSAYQLLVYLVNIWGHYQLSSEVPTLLITSLTSIWNFDTSGTHCSNFLFSSHPDRDFSLSPSLLLLKVYLRTKFDLFFSFSCPHSLVSLIVLALAPTDFLKNLKLDSTYFITFSTEKMEINYFFYKFVLRVVMVNPRVILAFFFPFLPGNAVSR